MEKFSGKRYPTCRSVTMNGFMGPETSAGPGSTLRWYHDTTDLLAGAPVENGIVFVDTHEDSITSGVFGMPEVPWWNEFPASRHAGAATLSFTDGHVIVHQWRDPRTIQPVRHKVLWGVKQPNNRDMDWILERATLVKSPYSP